MTSAALRGTFAFLIAVILWVVVGFLATAPLGAIYGWSGHPAIPAAPMAVYVIVYLLVLPVACGAAAWKTARWVESVLRR
jgi:hypothetical protein